MPPFPLIKAVSHEYELALSHWCLNPLQSLTRPDDHVGHPSYPPLTQGKDLVQAVTWGGQEIKLSEDIQIQLVHTSKVLDNK